MSTKKLLPRAVAENFFVSISSPLPAGMSLDCSRGSSLDCSSVSLGSCSSGDNVRRLLKLGKRFNRGNHGSIRGSWPIAISGSPRGHSVQNSDSVPKHTGSDQLSDTSLEPSVSRTEPTTTPEDGTNSLPETLKLLADVTRWRRNTLLSSKSLK